MYTHILRPPFYLRHQQPQLLVGLPVIRPIANGQSKHFWEHAWTLMFGTQETYLAAEVLKRSNSRVFQQGKVVSSICAPSESAKHQKPTGELRGRTSRCRCFRFRLWWVRMHAQLQLLWPHESFRAYWQPLKASELNVLSCRAVLRVFN